MTKLASDWLLMFTDIWVMWELADMAKIWLCCQLVFFFCTFKGHQARLPEKYKISIFLFTLISDSVLTHQVRNKHLFTHALNRTVISIIIWIIVNVRQKCPNLMGFLKINYSYIVQPRNLCFGWRVFWRFLNENITKLSCLLLVL